MELQIENLKAQMRGDKLNIHQRADALIEFNKLIEYTETLETEVKNLGLFSVSKRSELLIAVERELLKRIHGNGLGISSFMTWIKGNL